MATDKPRYSITVEVELFKKIEDFRFNNRYTTRADATAELIRIGLSALADSNLRKKENDALEEEGRT